MELNVVTLQKITFVKVLIGNVPTLLTGLVTANSDGSNQYVVTVPPELIQPTNKITLFISYTDTINVVGFTIKACTGNTLFLLNIEMILSSNLFNFSL